jgi:Flp pilus assembly protein TadD
MQPSIKPRLIFIRVAIILEFRGDGRMAKAKDIVKQVKKLRKEEQFDDAENLLRESLETMSEEWTLWEQLGHTLVAKEQFKEAEGAFRESIEIDPENFWLWTSLGYTLKEMDDLPNAIEATEKAFSLSKGKQQNCIAQYNLACYACLSGETEKALDYLEKAVKGDKSIKEWARDDDDFKSISETPEFLELVQE